MSLQDYETVAQRLAKWWADQPNGRVLTRIIESTGTAWTILAEVYDDRDDTRPSATGMAHGDPQGAKGAQATNPLEDGETSAIGRALANRGYAPSGARPSREEMQVAQAREQQPAPPQPPAEPVDLAPLEAVIEEANQAGVEVDAEAARSHAQHSDAHRDSAVEKIRAKVAEERLPF